MACNWEKCNESVHYINYDDSICQLEEVHILELFSVSHRNVILTLLDTPSCLSRYTGLNNQQKIKKIEQGESFAHAINNPIYLTA